MASSSPHRSPIQSPRTQSVQPPSDKNNNNNSSPSSQYQPPYIIHIPRVHNIDDVIFYVVDVEPNTNNKSSENSYSVHKRFSQFETLHSLLVQSYQHTVTFPVGCSLPPKALKWVQTHTEPSFVEERRCLLNAYLQKLLSVPVLSSSSPFLEFLKSDMHPYESDDPKQHALYDDSEITSVFIPATRTMSDHILYQIDVMNVRRRKTFSKWTVLKRFQQVYDMDTALRTAYSTNVEVLNTIPYPPARQWKLMYDHLEDTFVEHRRLLLMNYLTRLIHHPVLYKEQIVLDFLGVREV